MARRRFNISILAVLYFGLCSHSFSQETESPSILILGSVHFQNFGRDLVNEEIEDMLAPKRQEEIQAFVDLLADYKPTHIAVEFPKSAQAQVDEAYGDYVAGNIELRRNEAHQLGYRLGKRLGHTRIFAVDWNENPPGSAEEYDWVSFGQSNGFKDEIAALSNSSNLPDIYDLENRTVGEWLIDINDSAVLAALHRANFDIALIADDESQPGPNWVGSWYGRNLKIFRNLADIAKSPSDRLLVIYGLGHAHLLNQFAEESGIFEVIKIGDVARLIR